MCRVYGCGLHGECMVGVNRHGLRNCLDSNSCGDYATERPTWKIRFDQRNLAPGRKGMRFNASIIEDGDGFVMAYRDGWSGSDVWTVRLDRDFMPVDEPVLLNLRNEWRRTKWPRKTWRCPGVSVGREDPRLFRHKGRLHCAFIGVEPTRTNQCFARLNDDRTVDDAWQVNVPERRGWEKNWSMFEVDGDLYAVYLTHPFHTVVRIDCERATIVHREPNWFPWDGGELRGGAPPVRVGDEFWSFTHDRVDINGMPTYRMHLYTFDAAPPFAPRRMVREPILIADRTTKPAGVACCVFPCGAVRVGDDWIVSMGVHDRWTELRKFSHAELDRRLQPVERQPVPASFMEPTGLVNVTIGIGDNFRGLAEESSASVRRFYGCERSIILNESHLGACPPRHLFPDDPKRIFWLKWMVRQLFPNLDRWIYHDADYRAVREPDAETLKILHIDSRLIAVRDWWEEPPTDPYFNAGLFVANKSHDPLFEWCKANYWRTPEKFGDQCVINHGIKALGVQVLELPRSFNVGKPEQCPPAEVIAAHGYWHP